MADNKEITTLHPYMNRNKNRYPNVKEENIPDTIQRKLTAGTGISISPENVISATGGDSYTRSETDALLDTKADKVALENVNKAVPTDIAVKDGKLGLEHDTTWLTNQNAITLGDGLTYDEATKTLKAEGSGATLPAGTEAEPFIINNSKLYEDGLRHIFFESSGTYTLCIRNTLNNACPLFITAYGKNYFTALKIYDDSYKNIFYIIKPDNNSDNNYICAIGDSRRNGLVYFDINKNQKYDLITIPTDKTESYYLNATYDATSGTSAIKWSALEKTYNHYIVISDGTASNAIYLLIPSTNNIICNFLPDLNTLLGTEHRFIQASGVVTDTASKLPIVAINWQGSFSSSKIVTMSSEEATTKFTDISDIVEPA